MLTQAMRFTVPACPGRHHPQFDAPARRGAGKVPSPRASPGGSDTGYYTDASGFEITASCALPMAPPSHLRTPRVQAELASVAPLDLFQWYPRRKHQSGGRNLWTIGDPRGVFHGFLRSPDGTITIRRSRAGTALARVP